MSEAEKIHNQKFGTEDEAIIWEIIDKRNLISVCSIEKGISEDRKYWAQTATGQKLFLRISDLASYDIIQKEYDQMVSLFNHGVPVAEPMELNVNPNRKAIYTVHEWIDGKDAEIALKMMTSHEQYQLGVQAGAALQKIHSVEVQKPERDWAERYEALVDERIEAYLKEGIPFCGSDVLLRFYETGKTGLKGRPQCLLHGDYHTGNMMVSSDGKLYVIDLLDEGLGNIGDPWYDFMQYDNAANPHFFAGMVEGYFVGEPPEEFWNVATFYIVTAVLTRIVWAKYHMPEELPETLRQNEANAAMVEKGESPLRHLYEKGISHQLTGII